MRTTVAAWAAGVAVLALGQTVLIWRARRQGRSALPHAAFEDAGSPNEVRVLVVGDSLGVGVGATLPELSLAGLLGSELGAVQVVNRCQVGSRLDDVIDQVATVEGGGARFDLALVLAGASDVLRGTRAAALDRQGVELLDRLTAVAREVVWLGCADLGIAPAFLPPLSWWLSRRTRRVMGRLEAMSRARGVDFVDFTQPPHDRAIRRAKRLYFGEHGLHPSAEAHHYTFRALVERPAVRALRHAGSGASRVGPDAAPSAAPPAPAPARSQHRSSARLPGRTDIDHG